MYSSQNIPATNLSLGDFSIFVSRRSAPRKEKWRLKLS
jgi:hypothetical protein